MIAVNDTVRVRPLYTNQEFLGSVLAVLKDGYEVLCQDHEICVFRESEVSPYETTN